MCMCLGIHTYTKHHMYDTYNKQGRIIWSCKDKLSSGPKTRVEACKSFRTVTLSVPAAAWGPGQLLQQDRKTKDIYLRSSNREDGCFYLTTGYSVFQG